MRNPGHLPPVRALGAAFALRQVLEAQPVSTLQLRRSMRALAVECEPLLEDKECLAALAFVCARVSLILDHGPAAEEASLRPARQSLDRLTGRLRALQERRV